MTGHSRFSASASHRWLRCPGSIRLSEGKPNPETPWAAEGTRLHEAAASALSVFRHDPKDPIAWPDYGLTTEQIEVVQQYVHTIAADLEWGDVRWDRFRVEQKVSIPDLHPEFFGTADCIVVAGGKLTVYDLKCGAGVEVLVDYDGALNPQLGYYMLGAIVALGGKVTVGNIELPAGVHDLETVIVQPRFGGVKRRAVAVTELLELAHDLFKQAMVAELDDAPLAAGSHCRFCLARAECPALREWVREQARLEFGSAADMPDPDLSAVLRLADVIEAWIAAVREEARRRIEGGEAVPGYELKRGREGNRTWRNPEAAYEALVEWGIPADLAAPRKLVSPAEAERLAKIHVGEEIDLADMVERKPAPVSVVRTTAADDFAAVPEEV
ncbi:DUF2800 domain-containing protein [Enterovirga aerilata]|uniref:DUF2800 domain-containing protein n=1 Tax=Enterovirga aerilata TaxID=2730920 RepID=A0A849IBJ5_9HYPH|nr:DUF2800 domain-containing protein [Enterovirga sp. DB1703]NNM74778.1 DUF2800 domain-containing protein [Enterovirga sp. DB1703]